MHDHADEFDLSQLAAADVNLLAFNAVPIGPEYTQLVLFPEQPSKLVHAAERAGKLLHLEKGVLVENVSTS